MRASGKASAKGVAADISMDATQAEVQFEWWLNKRPGTGAVFHGVHLDYVPKKKLEFTGGITLDASEIDAQFGFVWAKNQNCC